MKINFKMWKTALSTLVKMESREEWEQLDLISKWLIATRSGVTIVTLYSCAIGGLLAVRDGFFSFWPWLIVTIGLFIAHGTNNLLNDYTDTSRGVDTDNYFRTQYGVHPLVQGFWSRRQQLTWFALSGFLAVLSGVFALFYTAFSPAIIALVCDWGIGPALLHLAFKTYRPGRTDHISDLGSPHGGRGLPRPRQGSGRFCLGCCPGVGALWPERGQHQHRKTHR